MTQKETKETKETKTETKPLPIRRPDFGGTLTLSGIKPKKK